MSDPTRQTRLDVYERDHHRCVVCGSDDIEFQHRIAVGAGGSKIRPLSHEGIVLCRRHNVAVEREMQTEALRNGWKVRRWVDDANLVPVYYPLEHQWKVLIPDEPGKPRAMVMLIGKDEAEAMMRAMYGREWDRWDSETRSLRTR